MRIGNKNFRSAKKYGSKSHNSPNQDRKGYRKPMKKYLVGEKFNEDEEEKFNQMTTLKLKYH